MLDNSTTLTLSFLEKAASVGCLLRRSTIGRQLTSASMELPVAESDSYYPDSCMLVGPHRDLRGYSQVVFVGNDTATAVSNAVLGLLYEVDAAAC